ncbi:hypothetical protein [Sphingobacterium hungaricum]
MLLITLIVSCTKDKKDGIGGKEGTLKFKVSFVETDEINQIGLVKNSSIQSNVNRLKNSSVEQDSVADTLLFVNTDFDALVGMSGIDSAVSPNRAQSNSALSIKPNKIAATTPMVSGRTFRVLIYNQSLTQLIVNQVVAVGTDPNIYIPAGVNYRWFAISLNSTGAVPDINGTGDIAANDLDNKDFIFDSGTISSVVGENYLNIEFNRQMTLIEVDLNTRGMFGKINATSEIELGALISSTFESIVKKGKFNIFNGNFTELVNATPVTADQMTVVDPVYGNEMKRAYFYTARTTQITAQTLRLRLNKLAITLDDNSTRTFANNTLVPIPHASSLQLQKGRRSTVNVRLVESGVSVGSSPNLWARTNMVYDANHPDKYRFRPNNNYSVPSAQTEYWNFGVTVPTATPIASNLVNPCRLVYPANMWKLPHLEAELVAIGNPNAQSASTVAGNKVYTMSWNISPASASTAYPDNTFKLHVFGYRNVAQTAVLKHFKDLALTVGQTAEGHYWASGISSSALQAAYLRFEVKVATVSGTNATYTMTRYPQGSTTGLGDMREGRMIRCVRNTTN